MSGAGTNGEFWGEAWKGEVDLGETKTADFQLLAFEQKGSIFFFQSPILFLPGIGAFRFGCDCASSLIWGK